MGRSLTTFVAPASGLGHIGLRVIRVSLPDPLLQIAADQAHAAGRKIDDPG